LGGTGMPWWENKFIMNIWGEWQCWTKVIVKSRWETFTVKFHSNLVCSESFLTLFSLKEVAWVRRHCRFKRYELLFSFTLKVSLVEVFLRGMPSHIRLSLWTLQSSYWEMQGAF
jgi:hypothetical protein